MVSDQLKNVCKIGQGHACCRYLVMAPGGFECVKFEGDLQLKKQLDARVEIHAINARGDNCEGKPKEELNAGK